MEPFPAGCVLASMGTNSGMRVLALLALAGGLAAAQSKEVHKTVPLAADGRVEMDNYKGSIRVEAWDRAEVQVDVRIEEDGGFFAAPVSYADARVEARAGVVEIESRFDRLKTFFGIGGSQPSFHYTVRMPRQARLKIEDYKSEIEVEGLAGDLDVHTYKGRLRARALEGGLLVDTYKGDVDAVFARFGGRTSVETYKGSVDLELPRGTGFDLRADLERKARFDSDFALPPRSSSGRRGTLMSGSVNGGGPELRVQSYKGSLRLLER